MAGGRKYEPPDWQWERAPAPPRRVRALRELASRDPRVCNHRPPLHSTHWPCISLQARECRHSISTSTGAPLPQFS